MKTFIFIMVTMNGFAYGIETDKETCYSEPESFMELKRDATTKLLADGNHQLRYFIEGKAVLFYYCALNVSPVETSYDDMPTFPNVNACRRKIRQMICVDRRE